VIFSRSHEVGSTSTNRHSNLCQSRFLGASEKSIVTHPVFPSVTDRRGVRLLHLKAVQPKSVLRDLCEEFVTEILYTRWPIKDVHPKRLADPFLMIKQSLIKRIITVNQQPVIVLKFQPRLDHRVKVTEKSADITITFDLEKTSQSVSVPMQISTLILQSFIPMSRVELVVFFNDHDWPAC
jgi:hypothetical protein